MSFRKENIYELYDFFRFNDNFRIILVLFLNLKDKEVELILIGII